MAPSSGHSLVPKALRIAKFAVSQAKSLFRPKTAALTASNGRYFHARTSKHISVHPTDASKQSRPNLKHPRSIPPASSTTRAIHNSKVAPFASTLRPNLTGGALPRSAGGYSLGNARGARYFSHTSSCQAQVIQNVNTGIRAFLVNGSKARYDGIDPATGNKRWKAVSKAEDKAYRQWQSHKDRMNGGTYRQQQLGTSLDFHISPTITALLPTKSRSSEFSLYPSSDTEETETNLHTSGLLSCISGDFARALRDLALIHHDLDRLSQFGALTITLHDQSANGKGPSGQIIRVHFPGCDADTVGRLCDEVGVKRGVICEDEQWKEEKNREVKMALLFPFAPSSPPSDENGQNVRSNHDSIYGSEIDPDVQEYFTRTRIHPQFLEDTTSTLTPLSSSALYSASHVSTGYIAEQNERSGIPAVDNPLPPSTLQSAQPSASLASSSGIVLTSQADSDVDYTSLSHQSGNDKKRSTTSEDFEGVEGIYRFLRECDEAATQRRSL